MHVNWMVYNLMHIRNSRPLEERERKKERERGGGDTKKKPHSIS